MLLKHSSDNNVIDNKNRDIVKLAYFFTNYIILSQITIKSYLQLIFPPLPFYPFTSVMYIKTSDTSLFTQFQKKKLSAFESVVLN